MDATLLTPNNTNAKAAFCKLCNTKIILANVGSYVQEKETIPDEQGITVEVEHWWSIPTVFSFENVGFTKNVIQKAQDSFAPAQNPSSIDDFTPSKKPIANIAPSSQPMIKFLTCAVCEKGIIGKQQLTDPKKIYLSVERVKYK